MESKSPLNDNERALICVGQGEINQDALSFMRDFVISMSFHPVVFHVIAPGSARQAAEKLMHEISEEIGFEDAEIRCVEGKVKEEIQNELGLRTYRVVVLGTTERDPGLPPSRLSQNIANSVNATTLLMQNPPPEINEILICTAGHSDSNIVVNWGIELAKATQEKVTILHVASGAPTMYTGLNAVEENLSQVLSRESPLAQHLKDAAAEAEAAGIKADIELRHGLVTEEIIRAYEMRPHHLIVLGAPKKGSIFNRILFGRIAPSLLASTHRSTLIIREGE
ncbi:MAG: universal stress protein [Anaerolineales bacterium]|nr:universal stress protein [Anaerolineales bacterium]